MFQKVALYEDTSSTSFIYIHNTHIHIHTYIWFGFMRLHRHYFVEYLSLPDYIIIGDFFFFFILRKSFVKIIVLICGALFDAFNFNPKGEYWSFS